MKKIIENIAAVLIILTLSVGVVSCKEEDPHTEYSNCQIVEKESAPVGRWFRLRSDGGISGRVYVMEIDWNAYEIGDTIKYR